jgi:glucosamine--fructose-6-phosphate aminotransferase (isomerizing)
MCGIVGCVGKIDVRDYLLKGLHSLDYRGYDSAGVAFIEDEEIAIFKCRGSVDKLDEKVKYDVKSNIGIGHTRWATHGIPNDINSHPHLSNDGKFSLVHNGVIENYKEIKKRLICEGFTFASETDSEVVVNLVEYCFNKTKDVLKALDMISEELKGSYALAILYAGEPDKLYFYKNQSPLLLGVAKGVSLLASDPVPMIEYTNKFIDLDDGQYGYLKSNEHHVYKDGKEIETKLSEKKIDLLTKDKKGYAHYMLKEIDEIDEVIQHLMDNYFDGNVYKFDPDLLAALKAADTIVFIACGTSYHASLVGSVYFEKIGKNSQVYIASEFGYYPKTRNRNVFYIMLSQSGETADLVRCMNLLKADNRDVLVITNTMGSTLQRMAKYSLYLYAGLEVSVASTKAYSAMVSILALLTSAMGDTTNTIDDLIKVKEIVTSLKTDNMKNAVHNIALEVKDFHDLYFLGRGYDYYLALEASLKLKEISYIHSEAFPGGELKHGPIALISQDVPVVVFISDKDTAEPIRGNIKEVESRGAKVYTVVSESLKEDGDTFVVPDSAKYLSPLVKSVIGFYLAYYVSLERGLEVDKPRNLAKAVTVE